MSSRTKSITAASLKPLPTGPEIRDIVDEFLKHVGGPSQYLRTMADAIDAGADPVLIKPVHEGTDILSIEAYWVFVNRRTYRCTEDHYQALKNMATLCNVSMSTVIRVALYWWAEMHQSAALETKEPS